MTKSSQWRDGKFHNTLKRHSGSIFQIISKRIHNRAEHTVPKGKVPVVKRCKEDFSNAPAGYLQVTWLGHSTILIEIDGYRVLCDPVWSERVSPVNFAGPKRFFDPPLNLDALPALDAIIISHDHYDHLDEQTIKKLKEKVPLFAVPLGIGDYLEKWGVDPVHIVECDWWGEVKIGRLTLTATPARHFSGRSLTSIYQDKTLWAGWSIAGPGHRVYFSGDSGMFPGFWDIGDRLGPFDITLIESGAYNELWPDVHLGPEQAVQAHRMVRGKLMIPVHWATFNLAMHNWTEPAERIIETSGKAGISVAIPRPGESVDIISPPVLVRWWPELPWHKADRAPVVSSGLPDDLLYEINAV